MALTEKQKAEGIQTEGRKLLIDWMAAELPDGAPKRTQAHIAQLLGVSQPAVRYWLQGTSRPEPHFRDALRELTGIPTWAWELDEERTLREDAIKAIQTSRSTGTDGGAG